MDVQSNVIVDLMKKIVKNQNSWVAKLPRLTQARPWNEEMRASDKFYCLLDEQPDELVPERFRHAALVAAEDSEALIINPCCWFSNEGMPPLELIAQILHMSSFLVECYTVWVGEPVTGRYTPFVLGPEYTELLQQVRTGKLGIQDLPIDVRANLLLAGIAIKRDFLVEQQKEWAKKIARTSAQFKEVKYVALHDLVPPLEIGVLRKRYRTLIQAGYLDLGDAQCPLRYGMHNDPIAHYLHYQLTGLISYVVGAPLKPSYTYFGAYQGGAELHKHKDREQCEYTVSLCIDYSPEPENETPWPIYVETPDGEVQASQSIGDGLLFKGRELPHYRHKLEEGSRSTSVFLHYVDADFQGTLG